MKWIRDEEFIRGNIPMTKFEIRTVTLGMLEISDGDYLLDVGAGTGSISVQSALFGARVSAVERESEGVNLIKENALKFNVDIDVHEGCAPTIFEDIKGFNKCFIGGSGGCLVEIVEAVHKKLKPGGLIVGNFITPDNMVKFKEILKKLDYYDIEIKLIQTSIVDKRGLLWGGNPVFIVKGRRI